MYDSLKSAISRLWWQLHCWRPGKRPSTLIWVWNAWGIHELSLSIIMLFCKLKKFPLAVILEIYEYIIIVSSSYLILEYIPWSIIKKTINIASNLGFPGIFRPSPHCERIPNQGVLEADSMAGPTLMAVTVCTDWWFQLLPCSIHFHDPQMPSIYTN